MKQRIKEIEEEYKLLKSIGDLQEIFPHLTGDWLKDKEFFIDAFLNNKLYE